MSFTQIFGGTTIYPAQTSYLSLTLAANAVLSWPVEQQMGGPVVSVILDVDATVPGIVVSLPDARQGSTGVAVAFAGIGANSFNVVTNVGGAVVTVAPGQIWIAYLADNTTQGGTWRTYQAGAGVSVANAASLAGAGIVAITTTLNQAMTVEEKSVAGSIVDGDRAKLLVWKGGTDSLTLPDPAAVGNNWFVGIRNSGSGILTLNAAPSTVDGETTIDLEVGESTLVVSDGSVHFTLGLGQSIVSAFDFISIDVTGSGSFTLIAAQQNRVAYEFTGVLSGNRQIIVPNTVQQYWVFNNTSGAFTLEVKTAAGTGIIVPQAGRRILYCDGTNVVPAETVIVTSPVPVTQGGTGLSGVSTSQILIASGTNTLVARDSGRAFPDTSPGDTSGIGFLSEDTGLTRITGGLSFVVQGVLRGTWGPGDFLNLGSSNLNFGLSGSSAVRIISGAGNPEGVVTAVAGSIFLNNTPTGAVQAVFHKVSGSGNTGWMPVSPSQTASKLADTDRTAVGFTADPHLTLALDADTVYRFESILFIEGVGGGGQGIQTRFAYSGTLAFSRYATIRVANGSATVVAAYTSSPSSTGVATISAAAVDYFQFTGVFKTTTAGTLVLEWGTNSVANTTRIQTGSFMTATRIDNT